MAFPNCESSCVPGPRVVKGLLQSICLFVLVGVFLLIVLENGSKTTFAAVQSEGRHESLSEGFVERRRVLLSVFFPND